MVDFTEMRWLNAPDMSRVAPDRLEITTDAGSDFWQQTYYGFTPDSGHALLAPAAAEFVAEVTFSGSYEALYDQAGLLVRAAPRLWVKAGVEFTDGAAHLSVVVTDGASDWSATPLESAEAPVTLRLTRMGDTLFVQYCAGEGPLAMARLAPFPPDARAEVGPMACSPKRAGFTARFERFSLGPVTSRDIH